MRLRVCWFMPMCARERLVCGCARAPARRRVSGKKGGKQAASQAGRGQEGGGLRTGEPEKSVEDGEWREERRKGEMRDERDER